MKVARNAATVMAVAVLTGWACTPAEGGGSESATGGVRERPAEVPEARLPAQGRAWVIFGADTVVAEVARTPAEREQGLMNRQELPDGAGMLFVFEESAVRSFWMQSTFVPLDIAFIDVGLRIVDIQQMEPMTTDPHESSVPVMFALEVPLGWFAAHGVRVGDKAEIVFGR